jgi:hypothetical protein
MKKFKEAINRNIAFHNGEMKDEILLTVSLPSTSGDWYGRTKEKDNSWIERDCYIADLQNRINLINSYHRQIESRPAINDDYVPVMYPTAHLGESYCAAMLGAVIDALSRESTTTVVPAYFDNLLNQKIARDAESIDMLKIIFDTAVFDIGSVFNWGSIWDEQHNFIQGRNENYLGFHERIEGRVQAALERTIEAMMEHD